MCFKDTKKNGEKMTMNMADVSTSEETSGKTSVTGPIQHKIVPFDVDVDMLKDVVETIKSRLANKMQIINKLNHVSADSED